MKRLFKLLGALALVALWALPTEVGAFWWGPGWGNWQNAYVYDPAYRWGTPYQRDYIRDLYRFGPVYAQWRQARRWW